MDRRKRNSGSSLHTQLPGLAVWLGITALAAAVGATGSVNAQTFYAQIVLPQWAPPAWIFGPVWTVLYALMGIAAWQVWRTGGFQRARVALILYLVQLAVNAMWSWLFFSWRLGFLALADVLLLMILILLTFIAFWRIRPLAGWLLMPYFLWVSFASALNFAIWQLNPNILG